MKLKFIPILLALASVLSMAMTSCKNKTDDPSSNVVGADGVSGETDIKIGEIETLDRILNFRLYTEKSGDKYYAIVGFAEKQRTKLEIPATFKDLPVRIIADSAFQGCKDITSLSIPDSVTVIGKMAFDDCDKIANVVIPDSVISMGERTFSDCDSLATVKIGNGLHTISENAFYSCDKLTTVQFGSAVRVIGHGAFSNCIELMEVTLPRELTVLGSRAFRYCKKLAKVELFDKLTEIGDGAFFGCVIETNQDAQGAQYLGNSENPYLVLCQISDKTVIEYAVREDTQYILHSVFADCDKLTSITLPKSITVISERAFEHCSALTDIQYGGTTDEWNAVHKAKLWDNQTGKYTVTCTDGTLSKNF